MVSEVLIINVITGKMSIMQSLITRMGILSLPGALLLDIEDIMLPTMAGSTSLNENCSIKGYCLGVKRSQSQSNPKIKSRIADRSKEIVKLFCYGFFILTENSLRRRFFRNA